MIKIIHNNLLESKKDVIAHQCNTVTKYGKGLSKDIFSKFPYSDDYSRDSTRITGTIRIHGDGKEHRYIANLFAQYYPGKPKYYETAEKRIAWMASCLKALGDFMNKNNLKTLAIPYGMGCGLAGGDWKQYRKLFD
jgi:O-acetyl-ADP-ribose deacetylase (regulator of RNase III)